MMDYGLNVKVNIRTNDLDTMLCNPLCTHKHYERFSHYGFCDLFEIALRFHNTEYRISERCTECLKATLETQKQ